jgi:hypothetical protein
MAGFASAAGSNAARRTPPSTRSAAMQYCAEKRASPSVPTSGRSQTSTVGP